MPHAVMDNNAYIGSNDMKTTKKKPKNTHKRPKTAKKAEKMREKRENKKGLFSI